MNLVWIPRPLTQGQNTARTLQDYGWNVVCEPLMVIHHFNIPVPYPVQDFKGLILTSQQVIFNLKGLPSSYPLFTVGNATAEACRIQELTNPIFTAQGNHKDLIALIKHSFSPSTGGLLYLRGKHIHAPLEALLIKEGYKVISHICYEAKEINHLPGPIFKVIQDRSLTTILIYSKRQATILKNLINCYNIKDKLRSISVIGISASALRPLEVLPFKDLIAAKNPHEGSILKIIMEHS